MIARDLFTAFRRCASVYLFYASWFPSWLRVLFIGLVLISHEKPGSRDGAIAGRCRLWVLPKPYTLIMMLFHLRLPSLNLKRYVLTLVTLVHGIISTLIISC